MAKMNIAKYFIVGLKSIAGSVIAGLLLLFFMFLTALLPDAVMLNMVFGVLLILLNVFIIGWIYNTFWGWK